MKIEKGREMRSAMGIALWILLNAAGCVSMAPVYGRAIELKLSSTCGDATFPWGARRQAYRPDAYCTESIIHAVESADGMAPARVPERAVHFGLERYAGITPKRCDGGDAIAAGIAEAIADTGASITHTLCPEPVIVWMYYLAPSQDLFIRVQRRSRDWEIEHNAIRLDTGEVELVEADPAGDRAAPRVLRPGEMVYIPAGSFLMGSSDTPGFAHPAHEVELSAYWIDRAEVTVGEYGACVAAGACPEGADSIELFSECNWEHPERKDHPVNCVDWYDARTYCSWAGKRLPTEAEWERAARGTAGAEHPWGEQGPSCRRIVWDEGGNGCGEGSTWPVGSKPAGDSPDGLVDTLGNVAEWVADPWDESYYARSPKVNPPGPETGGDDRGVRGGAWDSQVKLRVWLRGRSHADFRNDSIGFRCAKDE